MSRLPVQNPPSSPQSVQATAENASSEFDFDRWAVAVKRQMIQSLKRKGVS